MYQRALAFAALLAAPLPSMALTFAQAAENLLYFEYARLSADYCESRGVAARPLAAAWADRHAALERQSREAVRAEGGRRGMKPAEQDEILAAAIQDHRATAQRALNDKGMPCNRYAAWLAGYSDLLKR